MKYTVEKFILKGQDKRQNYALSVKFIEDDRTNIYWAVKKVPAIGDVVEGEIIDGEYGPRFKRSFEEGQIQGVKTGERSRANVDREDGQHQGMAIKAAIDMVIAFKSPETKLADGLEIMEKVARKIYLIDLSAPAQSIPVDTKPPLVEQSADFDMIDDSEPVDINNLDIDSLFAEK